MGESVVMILSNYALTKVTNATKMNSKCLYTYVRELLIVCWTVEKLAQKLLILTICNLSRIR